MMQFQLPEGKRIYFTSDHHFGAPDATKSRERERLFIEWLEEITPTAHALFIMGDFFDFWFEYKKVVPKGFVRVLGALASMVDKGIPIYFFVGNHDLWMRDYFEEELQIPVYHQPMDIEVNGTLIHLAHGDGLGDGDKGYKMMKKVFTHPFCQWLFRWLHPDWGVALAQHLSLKNKLISGDEDVTFLGEDKEDLMQYTIQQEQKQHRAYYIYGHRHLPMIRPLESAPTTYVNIGDWIQYFTYVSIDANGKVYLDTFRSGK